MTDGGTPRPGPARDVAYDAVVLAGGRARRFGGVDKPGLPVGGQPLVARVVAAVEGARRVVMVGPPREGVRADVTVREDPPGSGPVAALAAGLPHVTSPVVVVLASDLPFVTPQSVDALLAHLVSTTSDDVAVAVDDTGRRQTLLAAWRTSALRHALDGVTPHAGAPIRALYAGRRAGLVRLDAGPGQPPPWFDCDTPDDLRTAEGRT